MQARPASREACRCYKEDRPLSSFHSNLIISTSFFESMKSVACHWHRGCQKYDSVRIVYLSVSRHEEKEYDEEKETIFSRDM
jgi:hypothetical protein